MATYTNQEGSVIGTSAADAFIYSVFPASWATLDGLEGVDTVDINIASSSPLTVSVQDLFNSGLFQGRVADGPYGPWIHYYEVEDVTIAGSSAADNFTLKIGSNSSALLVDLDGGLGQDHLIFDFSKVTDDFTFQFVEGTITSSFGNLSSFELFTIYAGAGGDNIRTGSGADFVSSGTGTDTVATGAGDDEVYSESSGGTFDLGAGTNDYWRGNFSADTADRTVVIASAVTISDGTTVTNAESISLATGSGDDHFTVNVVRFGSLYGGEGVDTLVYDAPAEQGQDFNVTSYDGGMLDGDIDFQSFYEFERISFQGGDYDDDFHVTGDITAEQVTIDGGGGNDILRLDLGALPGATTFVVDANGAITTNVGQFSNVETFHLSGGPEADTFVTGGGNDQLAGEGGSDNIDAGAGADSLSGGDGNDSLTGGAGDDILDGGLGGDAMHGGLGDDIYIVGSSGDTTVENAGEGTDLVISTVSYALQTNIENLTLTYVDVGAAAIKGTGNALDNILIGNEAGNSLYGLGGNDLLYGEGGDDWLDGRLGADTHYGGLGNDIYVVENAGDVIVEYDWEGVDLVRASVAHVLHANVENLTLTSTKAIDGTGNELANVLTGNAAANRLYGLAGADTLVGNAGNDTLDGGLGADLMQGGIGDDIYGVDSSSDKTIENAGEGTDLVNSSITHVLKANIENLTLTGTAGIKGTGNALDNVLAGNAAANYLYGLAGADTLHGNGGNDWLDGGAGADTLHGGLGKDTYVVDSAGDVTVENASHAGDMVRASVSHTLQANIENLTLTGAAAIDGSGNELANKIAGNGAANVLSGGAGNDSITGGAGRDTTFGGAGADTFRFDEAHLSGSTTATSDVIGDFSQVERDKIGLVDIDANVALAGNQAFQFIGASGFGGVAGQLRYEQAGGNTYVQGDWNGDSVADFMIRVNGLITLQSADFLL